MSGALVTVPLYLACQLIASGCLSCGNVTVDTLAPSQTTVLPDGYTAFHSVGAAYKFHSNYRTWNAARKLCMDEGGNLPIVDSYDKLKIIVSMKNKTLGVHTGVHRLYDDREWISIKTGKGPTFIPWIRNANTAITTEKCLALWGDGTGLGPWTCTYPLPVICEIPIIKRP